MKFTSRMSLILLNRFSLSKVSDIFREPFCYAPLDIENLPEPQEVLDKELEESKGINQRFLDISKIFSVKVNC